MKKIFAISVLSVMAVVGTTNAWAQAPDNRNLATVSFVERSLGDFAGKNVIGSNTTVGGTNDYYSNDYVPTTAWVNKQDEKYAETIAASLDTKVDRAQIVTSAEGQAVTVMGASRPVSKYSMAVQMGEFDAQESMDSEVASVNTVAEHFVPSVALEYRDDYYQMDEREMQPGLYTIMVQVDDSGNKTFIWQAVQQARYRTSVGGEAGQ